jgi:hypothetical protein
LSFHQAVGVVVCSRTVSAAIGTWLNRLKWLSFIPALTAHSIQKSQWARAYYEKQLSRGKKHHAAVRALAYKWIRVVFRCWKNGVPYAESVHIKALNERRLPEPLPKSSIVNLQWKSVAGFLKISAANS